MFPHRKIGWALTSAVASFCLLGALSPATSSADTPSPVQAAEDEPAVAPVERVAEPPEEVADDPPAAVVPDPVDDGAPPTDEPQSTEPDDPPAAAKPKPVPLEPAEISRLVEQLGAPSYEAREIARTRLIKAGPQVLDAVVKAAGDNRLEVSVRAMSVFSKLYQRVEEEDVDVVEDAFDVLLTTNNPSIATRAASLADDLSSIREVRALEKIQDLGGVVERSTEAVIIQGRLVAQPAPDGKGMLASVRLDPDTWKGGDEGLKYVKRLRSLRRLYLVSGAISKTAREELVAALPDLDIQGRGRAYLGIGGAQAPGGAGGCYVQTVRPGAAAAKAGLQPGDVIEKFDGKQVDGFPQLVELIGDHAPGDKVKTAIIRNGFQKMELEITLGRWSDNEAAVTPPRVPRPTPPPPLPDPDRR